MSEDRPAKPSPTCRRLILCLDGTWNDRDSCTNVYHLSNMVKEGTVSGSDGQSWKQLVYYDPGVGTSAIDSITGGAFGLGLSKNVREAYDWLLEKYEGGDEIYIFGFSRGAFTARSMVGLLAKCGLLRRGAPITVEQVWKGYRRLGEYRDGGTLNPEVANEWREDVHRGRIPFRPIWILRSDWWKPDRFRDAPCNLTEELLKHWSRRVSVKCVGVMDTVGSMGLDALAIPGLGSRSSRFHDTRLSSMVEHAFHALAIDEHRGNFAHTPWQTPLKSPLNTRTHVEQTWFLGCHSNIGGGYADGVLSQEVLTWLLERTSALGLVFKRAQSPTAIAMRNIPPLSGRAKNALIRDSFSEFAGGFWKHIIRGKRNYRRIAPQPLMEQGIPVQSAGESIHPSVAGWLGSTSNLTRRPYTSPNLWEYLQRHSQTGLPPLPDPRSFQHQQRSPGEVLVSLGFRLLWMGSILWAFWGLGTKWALGLTFFAGAMDAVEGALNFTIALRKDTDTPGWLHAGFEVSTNFRWMGTGVALIGIGKALWWCGTHLGPLLHKGAAGSPSGWLFAFLAMGCLCWAAMAWTAYPLKEATKGSILLLQKAVSRRKVGRILLLWAGWKRDRNLLQPVVRSLWRDIYDLIPTTGILIFFGAWALGQIWGQHVFWWDWSQPPTIALPCSPLGWPLLVALAYVLSDLIEDAAHLHHIRQFPKLPSRVAVGLGVAATWTKGLSLLVGVGSLILSTLWLFQAFIWAMFRT